MPINIDIEHAYPRVNAAINALADWIERAKHLGLASHEFSTCAPAEMDKIARDLGISTTELRAIADKGPDAAQLLIKRMEALHLDPKKILHNQPAVMHDLQRLCSLCEVHSQCQKDLITDRDNPNWKTYCPNVGTLEALTAQR